MYAIRLGKFLASAALLTFSIGICAVSSNAAPINATPLVVGGVCRAKLAVKLAKSTKGKRLRLKLALPGYAVSGAADVEPFAKALSLRVPHRIR